MKKRITLAAALLVLAVGCSAARLAVSQKRKPGGGATPPAPAASTPAPEGTMMLRNKWLTSDVDEIGLGDALGKANVWGAMMELALPVDGETAVGTVFSALDGTASLYTSRGGGILGGYSAKEPAQRFVAEAEKHLAHMKPTKAFPHPRIGRVKFYVMTRKGVYTADASDRELGGGRHALSRLSHAGHEVLTGLRLASGRARPTP